MRVEAYAQKSIHNVWQQIDKIKYESTDVNENQCKVCCNVKTWIKRGRGLIFNFHWHSLILSINITKNTERRSKGNVPSGLP